MPTIQEILPAGEIEAKIREISGYLSQAAEFGEAIEHQVAFSLQAMDECPGPKNLLQPFLFSRTSVAPAEILYRGSSLIPCIVYEENAATAALNAWRQLEYLQSLWRETESAAREVERQCADNGMSDQFKATVAGVLRGYRDLAGQINQTLANYHRDAVGFLTDYRTCLSATEQG